MNDRSGLINLRLADDLKKNFKEKIRDEGYSSMQEVLSAFVRSFTKNPKKFVITMTVVEGELV